MSSDQESKTLVTFHSNWLVDDLITKQWLETLLIDSGPVFHPPPKKIQQIIIVESLVVGAHLIKVYSCSMPNHGSMSEYLVILREEREFLVILGCPLNKRPGVGA